MRETCQGVARQVESRGDFRDEGKMAKPFTLMLLGAVLLVFGVVLPLLMVADLLELTLPLGLLAQTCSIAGLITGFAGISRYLGTPG